MLHQKRVQISNRLQKQLKRKSSRKRLVRFGLIAANVVVLGVVVVSVISSSHNDHSSAMSVAQNKTAARPVDGVTAYDIAANVAQMTALPEGVAIVNQAQSARAAVAVSTSDTTVIAKPQIVNTALKSKNDIKAYTVAAGDTVTSIAQKFGVTSDSIKWSNNLTSDTVSAGTKLTVPPPGVSGVVYTVKAGDTVQTLAAKYKANADQITAYNDAEIAGLVPGQQIIIPGGQVAAVAATGVSGSRLVSAGSFVAQYGSNGYVPGYCTYYAAARSGAPSNWGNANTWAYYAALSGWTVSSTPRVGAIAQTSGMSYLGHVGIVEAVSDDGSQIKYSDMNGISGYGRVGYSGWVSASTFQHYIYR